jgi:hypothetical protein
MWILPLVGYTGVILGFCFLTLAIGKHSLCSWALLVGHGLPLHGLTSETASGLYYLSELVEEHTVATKKVLTYLIYLVIILQTLLFLVDGFPAKLSLLTIGSHVVYLQNLRHFPAVKLTDPLFILSCGSYSLPSH